LVGDISIIDMKQTGIGEIAALSREEGKTRIEERIFTIRGKQVMLDRDLALLYGVETKALNQAVKRNIERFPDDFMFQLDYQECLRSQIVTLNTRRGQHLKYMPYAFTEQGVAMLSGVIKSAKAVEVNIKIMRAFVIMRNMVANDSALNRRMTELEFKQKQTDINVEKILKIINETDYIPRQGIFFDGQIYDAYTFVADLVRTAARRIVLIDNYIDDTVLTMLSKRVDGVEATIYTGKVSKQLQLDIDKHNAQYPPITVCTFSKAHDRFLIIDDAVYLVGASIKDLGKKWFGFTLMENTDAEDLMRRM